MKPPWNGVNVASVSESVAVAVPEEIKIKSKITSRNRGGYPSRGF